MSIFYLKQNDTRPVLEAALANADDTPYDLTGCTIELIVGLNDGSVFSRAMTIYGLATGGVVRYQWTTADWDDTNTAGFLILGSALGVSELNSKRHAHRMEYEVTTSDSKVVTFPNDGYDTLIITEELGSA